jgi:hypothetical protein
LVALLVGALLLVRCKLEEFACFLVGDLAGYADGESELVEVLGKGNILRDVDIGAPECHG